jgi:hypothetical protein
MKSNNYAYRMTLGPVRLSWDAGSMGKKQAAESYTLWE